MLLCLFAERSVHDGPARVGVPRGAGRDGHPAQGGRPQDPPQAAHHAERHQLQQRRGVETELGPGWERCSIRGLAVVCVVKKLAVTAGLMLYIAV